jgi:DNA-binding NtrC family response regulator
MRILIADDDASMREGLIDILEAYGYQVDGAVNGADAVEKCKNNTYDLIFMDMKMPVMNGVQSYKEIKKILPEAVVVMITAYFLEDLIADALKGGVYGVLYKPLDIDRIVELIENTDKGALVMVVDDDPNTLRTFKDVLERKGHLCYTAKDGEEAIQRAEEKKYNIIFIDLKLPTINGLETYLRIREVNSNVVAVMITGYRKEMTGHIEEALKSTAYTCLYKPFNMDDVIRLVEEVLKKKGGINNEKNPFSR